MRWNRTKALKMIRTRLSRKESTKDLKDLKKELRRKKRSDANKENVKRNVKKRERRPSPNPSPNPRKNPPQSSTISFSKNTTATSPYLNMRKSLNNSTQFSKDPWG